MITVTLHGAGGWFSAFLWLGMAVAVPAFCFWFGRQVGRDDVEDRIADEEQAAWMQEHAAPSAPSTRDGEDRP